MVTYEESMTKAENECIDVWESQPYKQWEQQVSSKRKQKSSKSQVADKGEDNFDNIWKSMHYKMMMF